MKKVLLIIARVMGGFLVLLILVALLPDGETEDRAQVSNNNTNVPLPTPDIPATVSAEVQTQMAAMTTATPRPTHTPSTATAYPTVAPELTATPHPTATPSPTHTSYPTPTLMPTPTPRPTAVPTPTIPPAPFGNGTHLVGVEIQPGTYRAEVVGDSNCYWARLSGFGGTNNDIIVNENVGGSSWTRTGLTGSTIVIIAPTDVGFESTRCGQWKPWNGSGNRDPNSFGSGTHLVGQDIQPGTYRAEAAEGSSCYWARRSGFTGSSRDIIADDRHVTGSVIVTIAPTDKAFQSENCGQWERALK